jgi:hypothetical protein
MCLYFSPFLLWAGYKVTSKPQGVESLLNPLLIPYWGHINSVCSLILLLSSHLRDITNGLLVSRSLIKMLYAFLISPTLATYLDSRIFLDFFSLSIFVNSTTVIYIKYFLLGHSHMHEERFPGTQFLFRLFSYACLTRGRIQYWITRSLGLRVRIPLE